MKAAILYVCGEDKATTKQRLLALKDMKADVDVIYHSLLNKKRPIALRAAQAALRRLGFHPEQNNENRQILDKVSEKNYDLLFIEKGLTIRPSTLRKVRQLQPAIKVISYFLDDIIHRHNFSHYYRKALHLYDYHFTMNRWNVDELKEKGVKNAIHFYNAFSTHVHKPVSVTAEDRAYYGGDIGFIGTYEAYRVECIRYLAEHGYKIKIWGWGKDPGASGMIHPNIINTGKYVFDEAYPKVVCSTKINLCFLRKLNRDTQTTRTFEIPAMGGFMLAERTDDHKRLFAEDVEAAYFSSKEELLEKVKYYLQNEDKRKQVAQKGLERSLNSKYSYQDQLQFIISTALGEKTGDN
jgi:spore maturation protein CgeB